MAAEHQDIHDELRSVARDLLATERPAKGAIDWQLLAQAGWIGLEAAESHGGAGVSFAEVAVVLDEMGRAAAPSAYLGGAVLAIGALNALDANASRDRLLARVSSGEATAAVALPTDGGSRPQFRLDGRQLSGRVEFVPDAGHAEVLLLPAEESDGTPVVVAVPADTAGLRVDGQPVLDETRLLAGVSADGVAVDSSAVWRFTGDADAAVGRLLDRARVALACDSLGLSEAMLADTVSYVAVRQQFGRPIGSFQAVKHACADMLVQVAVGRRLVGAAVDAVAHASPDATTAALMAKSHACAMAVDVVGKAMQLHGGIGYTWESGVHVYLKRAALNRSLFGSPAAHRKQLAARYL
jgi:alkylation response protein AidB-like acyl-CoA dehydrogenase